MAKLASHSVEALMVDLAKKREALRAFRNAGAGSRTKNVREGRATRKDIARILTELRVRTLANSKKTA